MKYKVKDKEVNIVFDGQYYIGTYGCIQIKRLFKIDVIDYFNKKFGKQINSQFKKMCPIWAHFRKRGEDESGI